MGVLARDSVEGKTRTRFRTGFKFGGGGGSAGLIEGLVGCIGRLAMGCRESKGKGFVQAFSSSSSAARRALSRANWASKSGLSILLY